MSKFTGDIDNWDVSNVLTMKFMFYQSIFNSNLMGWTPYKLKSCFKAFEDYPSILPYWANLEDKEQRIIAINNYLLKQELEEKIDNSNNDSKKLKYRHLINWF